MRYAFENCITLNQDINIPSNVNEMAGAFKGCTALASSTTKVHISPDIEIGDTTNFIYNSLVNNSTGINWTGRIVNDFIEI